MSARFDHAAIFRAAHATANYCMEHNRAWRSYRQALRQALKREWYQARLARAKAEIEAETPVELPQEVSDHCASLRLEASYEPHTFAGHARFNALHQEADEIAAAYQAAVAISGRQPSHHRL